MTKCPHCKSKDGYIIDYKIIGNGTEIRNFAGEVIEANRDVVDQILYVYCKNCNKELNINKLKL